MSKKNWKHNFTKAYAKITETAISRKVIWKVCTLVLQYVNSLKLIVDALLFRFIDGQFAIPGIGTKYNRPAHLLHRYKNVTYRKHLFWEKFLNILEFQ